MSSVGGLELGKGVDDRRVAVDGMDSGHRPIVSFSNGADPGLARLGGCLADAQSPREAERVESGDARAAARGAGAKRADDAAVRAVLLTGPGRGFCTGQDLSERDVSAAPRRSISRCPRLVLQPAGAAHARAAQADRRAR